MIYFTTPTEFDPQAFTFGLSVKENDNPIGFFGTGLKYAIAILLRTGHTIDIVSTSSEGHISSYTLSAKQSHFRGQEFNMIYCNDQPLNFTTELGKNWEIWMAYRELVSNTKDEGGTISLKDSPATFPSTTIIVTGEKILEAFENHSSIFLDSHPLCTTSEIEVHKNNGTPFYYYRGIRVGTNVFPAQFTYNIIKKETLTEDRTLSISDYYLADRISQLDDKEMLEAILTSPTQTLEGRLQFSNYPKPPQEFIETALSLRDNARLNGSALSVAEHFTPEDEIQQERQPTDLEKRKLIQALSFLSKLDYHVTEQIIICKLRPHIIAQAKDGKIFLTTSAFDMGIKQLTMTILEEHLHLTTGFGDETRELQNKLFEIIITLGEKLTNEPL